MRIQKEDSSWLEKNGIRRALFGVRLEIVGIK